MALETLMLKLSGAAQAAQVPALSGQSFVVGKAVATGDGLGKWLFLHPLSCSGPACGAGGGMVALKLEGAQQAGLLSSLIGKTVTVGQSPIGTAAANNWLVLQPYLGGAAGKGAAAAGMMAKGAGFQQMGLRAVEIEGAGKASMAGKGAVVGKGALTGKACVIPGAAGKGMFAGKGVGAIAKGNALMSGPVVMGGIGGAKTAATATATTTGGTIWTGSGTSLGLGLGLGSWGPLLLVAMAAGIGVGIYSYMQRPAAEDEIADTVS